MARPDTQTRLAVEMIRKRLQHGDHPASPLPGERQLAIELGLSRPTVRKAVRQLADEGLLARGPTGRLTVAAAASGKRAPLIAFLHPGQIAGESALWRDGVYTAAEECGAVVRSLGYAHYGDAAISAALEGFDGVFLLQLTDEKLPSTLVRRMTSGRARVVVLDRDESAAGLRSVIVFPFSSGDKLLTHLQALGHRRIDCLNVHASNSVIEARIAGWRAFIERHGLAGELLARPADGSLGSAYKWMASRLKSGKPVAPALYGTTVHAAIGAMRALHEAGRRIGRDVSVCAVNDEGLGPYLVPSLTSLQTPPRARYLRKAVNWMTGKAGWPVPSLEQPREAPLFIGESTGPAPK
ncbi:MAG: GntR family transcriptional regulator [Rariglobus sp.]|jgi:DNA-binding LacI/PurR family transcriptional regulator|nr:GntR family transcriptional regulator [Rariglobus sp.]